jgi:hypothetical protein
MTTPHGEPAAPAPEVAPDAVPVHVRHDVNVQNQAADFGSYVTYKLPAGATAAQPIAPFDPARHKLIIIVSAPGAVVAGSGVWIGSQAQTQASPPVGGFLPAGTTLPVEHNQAIWLVGDGTNAMNVTVAMERWDNSGGN